MSSRRLRNGGNRNRDDVQAVEEVLAKLAGLDGLLQVLVGGGQHAGVQFEGPCAADAVEFALLQDPQQLGLHGRRHLADLVQQHGAVFRNLKLALLGGNGAGERTFLVAEELALQQCVGNGGAVDGHERLVGARAVGMNGPRHQFLAGAALAANQHRAVALRDFSRSGRPGGAWPCCRPRCRQSGSSSARKRRFSACSDSSASTFSSVTAAMPAAEFRKCTWSSSNLRSEADEVEIENADGALHADQGTHMAFSDVSARPALQQ